MPMTKGRTRRRMGRPPRPAIEPMTKFLIRIPTATLARLNKLRWKLEQPSITALIRQAVDEFIAAH